MEINPETVTYMFTKIQQDYKNFLKETANYSDKELIDLLRIHSDGALDMWNMFLELKNQL